MLHFFTQSVDRILDRFDNIIQRLDRILNQLEDNNE